MGGNVKSAQWLLERRWPNDFRQPTSLEVSGRLDSGMEAAVLLVHRLQTMTPEQLEAEHRALGWVDGEPEPEGAPRADVPPDTPRAESLPSRRRHPAPLPAYARDDEPPLLEGMTIDPADLLGALPEA